MSAQMTRGAPAAQASPRATAGGESFAFAYAMATLAVVVMWVGVVLAMIYSPDFVSGSQHQHMASAWGDWIWSGIGTGFVAMTVLQGIRTQVTARAPWLVLGLGVSVVWVAVVLASVFTPVWVTGTDPTMIPYAAWGTPIIGLVATWFITAFVRATFTFRAAPGEPPAAGDPDIVARLNQLAALRDAGTVTPEEYGRKKAELLARL